MPQSPPPRMAVTVASSDTPVRKPRRLSLTKKNGGVKSSSGLMDAAGTWDRVAPSLAAAGYRVLAPDMRGFGVGAAEEVASTLDDLGDVAEQQRQHTP